MLIKLSSPTKQKEKKVRQTICMSSVTDRSLGVSSFQARSHQFQPVSSILGICLSFQTIPPTTVRKPKRKISWNQRRIQKKKRKESIMHRRFSICKRNCLEKAIVVLFKQHRMLVWPQLWSFYKQAYEKFDHRLLAQNGICMKFLA